MSGKVKRHSEWRRNSWVPVTISLRLLEYRQRTANSPREKSPHTHTHTQCVCVCVCVCVRACVRARAHACVLTEHVRFTEVRKAILCNGPNQPVHQWVGVLRLLFCGLSVSLALVCGLQQRRRRVQIPLDACLARGIEHSHLCPAHASMRAGGEEGGDADRLHFTYLRQRRIWKKKLVVAQEVSLLMDGYLHPRHTAVHIRLGICRAHQTIHTAHKRLSG